MRYLFVSSIVAVVCGTSVVPAMLAQGAASVQGFGYPPGELSTRALGTAGALGDVDARSPINPAAIAIRSAAQVYAQYDPEFRSVTGQSGATSSSLIARFPNVGGILPVSQHLVIGVSASTLLDRTFATQTASTLYLAGDTVAATEALKSQGGITDLRLAAAYAFGPRFRVGVGLHGYTGSDRVTSSDVFSDTLRYRDITQVANLSYSGKGVSAGVEVEPFSKLSLAVSARKGGGITMYANDTAVTHASIPDRYSGSVSFLGLPGTVIVARASHERWTELAALSTMTAPVVDANDFSLGIESAGPRVGGFPLLVRLGARRRTLPFAVATPTGNSSVQETSFGGGLGVPIAFDRVTLDLAALRSSRTGVAGISEHAYNLSFGLQVHP